MNNQLSIPGDDFSPKKIMLSALQDVKIMNCNNEELLVKISSFIENCLYYIGSNKTEEDRDFLKMAAINDCKYSFKTLTVSEIKIALDNGVRGLYGEVYGMAPKEVYHWLSSYSKDALRLQCKKELMPADDTIFTPSETELIYARRSSIEKSWNKFKEDGFFRDYGNYVYNLIDRNGLIDFSTADKQEIFEQAKINLMQEHDPTKFLGNPFKIKEHKNILDSLEHDPTRIKAESRQIALNIYYKKLVDGNINLVDLIQFDLK